MKRTTIPLDEPLQNEPVIGRNIFELAAASDEEKAKYLPAGLSLRSFGTEGREMFSVKANGVDVGHFQRRHQEDAALNVICRDSFEIKLGDGRTISVDNKDDYGVTSVTVKGSPDKSDIFKHFRHDDYDSHGDIRCFLSEMNEAYPLFIDQIANSRSDLTKIGPVTLIDGTEIIGPFTPDVRLVRFLAEVDSKIEELKVEAEQQRLGIETAAQAAARAEEERQRALEIEKAQEAEAERRRALDSIFSM